MSVRLVILLGTLLTVFLTIVPGASAQGSEGARGASDVRAERLRAWQQLDATEQAKLRERFEALKKLPGAERARLVERASRLRQEMKATLASLGAEERAAIEALGPKERARVLRTLVADRARGAAARLRERLTPAERERLDGADPAERAKILRAVRQREKQNLPKHLVKLTRAMDLSAGEMRKIQGGNTAEKRQAIAAFVRRRARTYVKEHGLPSSLEPADWDRALAQDDRTFLRTMMGVRARHPEFGIPAERWEKRVKQRQSLHRRLVALSTPSAKDRVRRRSHNAAHADGRGDRATILRHRARLQEILRRHAVLSPDAAARLRALDDDGFVRVIRYLSRQLGANAEPGRALDKWFAREADSRR